MTCNVTHHMPIVSFEHRGLAAFWTQGSKAGIQPEHASRLRIRLDALNAVTGESDVLALPRGWRRHQHVGRGRGRWSIDVSGNWRLTFELRGGNVALLDYTDPH